MRIPWNCIRFAQFRSNSFKSSLNPHKIAWNSFKSNINQIKLWIKEALYDWKNREDSLDDQTDLVFSRATNRANQQRRQEQLYVDIDAYENKIYSKKWQVPMSLRVIEPEAAIKIKSI